jgi:hypothetical protein
MKIFFGGLDYITENGVELFARCEEQRFWYAMFGNARLKYFEGKDASIKTREFMKKFATDNFELVNIE